MIKTSDGYQKAIVADSRRMVLRAAVDIIDPNMVIVGGSSSGETEEFSHIDNIYDKEISVNGNYASLEWNRWILDGGFTMDPVTDTGFVSFSLSGENGDSNIQY